MTSGVARSSAIEARSSSRVGGSVSRSPVSVGSMRRSLPKGPECAAQAFDGHRIGRLLAQRAHRTHGVAELIEVDAAVVADREVLVEARVVVVGECAVEVRRDELDQLLAGELSLW